jgi:DMSO/TMAO reductase YedYZ heme-binding membrane subunit
MAATSNDASQRLLGRGWGRLHRTGIWYLAFIYAYTYLGRVREAPAVWPALALATMLAIAALRAVAWQRKRRTRALAPSGPAPAR